MDTQPNDTLKVTIGSKECHLFMPYALVSDISDLVTGEDGEFDGNMPKDKRDQIIIMCLTKRGRAGAIEGEIDLYDVAIEREDLEAIVDWAMEHVLAFFIRRMNASNEMMARLTLGLEEQMAQASSPDTSED